MAEKNMIQSTSSLPQVLASIPQGAMTPDNAAALQELLKLQIQIAQRQIQLDTEMQLRNEDLKQKDLDRRKSSAREAENKRLKDIAKQNACPHRNEFNKTTLDGQKLNSSSLLLICQLCGKEFKSTEDIAFAYKNNLVPSGERIGRIDIE